MPNSNTLSAALFCIFLAVIGPAVAGSPAAKTATPAQAKPQPITQAQYNAQYAAARNKLNTQLAADYAQLQADHQVYVKNEAACKSQSCDTSVAAAFRSQCSKISLMEQEAQNQFNEFVQQLQEGLQTAREHM